MTQRMASRANRGRLPAARGIFAKGAHFPNAAAGASPAAGHETFHWRLPDARTTKSASHHHPSPYHL